MKKSLLEHYGIPSFLGEKARTNELPSACNHTHLWLLKAIYDASIAYLVEWRCQAGWAMKDSKISRRSYIAKFENNITEETMKIQIGVEEDYFIISHFFNVIVNFNENKKQQKYSVDKFVDENKFVEWLHEY